MEFTLQIKDMIDLYTFYTVNPEDMPYPRETPQEVLRYNRALGLSLITEEGILNQNKGKMLLGKFEKKLEIY